jgi:hypothetical protein
LAADVDRRRSALDRHVLDPIHSSSDANHHEVIRAREEQRRLRRIPAVIDREKTILASPCSIKSLEGPACHSFLPSPPRSISTPLYLFVLHITASDLAGVHHGVVNRDHPRVFGVV